MENSAWLKMWEENTTGWHRDEVNPFLERNYEVLKDSKTIFIPLCGKTLDIPWLVSHGHKVVGCELSHIAIVDLYKSLDIKPDIMEVENFKIYNGGDITIFEGDFFNLTSELLGTIDGIYDRGALVALKKDIRDNYTKHLQAITNSAKQLVIVYNYDQEKRGYFPPFSISQEELNTQYSSYKSIELIDSIHLTNGIDADGTIATEKAWFLS